MIRSPHGRLRLGRIPYRRSRRWLFGALVSTTTLIGALMMLDIVRAAGITLLEIGILALFVPTFAWISISFWNALVGFTLQLLEREPNALDRARAARGEDSAIVTRTALVMPAHNESPERVVGGLASMLRSLESTGQAAHFDVHLLSDTTDEALAGLEEAAWSELRASVPRPARLHYRRRAANVDRKAGNIADFCRASGAAYDFMVVLDADSVMSGPTLVALVRAMQDDPRVGLIQTVPIPARQETLFGRLIQFAGALYSPMLAAGQAFWQTDCANYWGHNAILRMRPFVDHCRLPVLPGAPPLGGPVLSHDFVEAALLRKGGWHVYLATSLDGSYEEVPANVLDFAKRDRRWAQGSLQHLRLLPGRGWRSMSRLHFACGAMGYLSSVLWLFLLVASTIYVLVPAASAHPLLGAEGSWSPEAGLGRLDDLVPLLALTAGILFLPKVLGVTLALLRRPHGFGGALGLGLSACVEACFAVLVAPLMMLQHTGFVLSILAGRDGHWEMQRREPREIPWLQACIATSATVAVGIGWAGVTLYSSPAFFVWLTPIFAGLLLAAPIVHWTSSARLGRALRSRGILLVPSECLDPPELRLPRERSPGPGRPLAGVVSSGAEPGESKMHEIERGLFDLRKGRPLRVVASGDAPGSSVLCAAVEGLTGSTLARLKKLSVEPLRLVVTSHRATSMGVRPGQAAADGIPLGVSLSLNGETPERVFTLSSAPGTFDPVKLDARPATEAEVAALALTRLGRLLPAVVCVEADPNRVPELRDALRSAEVLTVPALAVRALADVPSAGVEVTHVSEAHVPLEQAEDARFMLFREVNGLLEHVAVLIGDPEAWPDPVPVRLHSACLTGDLFGSLRCDCGEQLRLSLRSFAASGGGVLLYLRQEGRGIGLANKLRAYTLQQEGLDTVEADGVLGFGADERHYDAAVGMLRHLGIERVKILTNNPQKVRALEAGGIHVVDREPLHGTLNPHNLPYVRAKVHRAGHWLSDMLHGAFPGS